MTSCGDGSSDAWDAVGKALPDMDADEYGRFVDKLLLRRAIIHEHLVTHAREMQAAGATRESIAAACSKLEFQLLGVAALSSVIDVKQGSLIRTQAELVGVCRRLFEQAKERIDAVRAKAVDALQRLITSKEEAIAALEARRAKHPSPEPTDADKQRILSRWHDLKAAEPAMRRRDLIEHLRQSVLPEQTTRIMGEQAQFPIRVFDAIVPAGKRGRPSRVNKKK